VTEEEETAKRNLIRAYRIAFLSPAGQTAMKDLMSVCRFRHALVPLSDLPTTNELFIAEGRRQVFIHILQMTQINEEDLITMFKGGTIVTPEDPYG